MALTARNNTPGVTSRYSTKSTSRRIIRDNRTGAVVFDRTTVVDVADHKCARQAVFGSPPIASLGGLRRSAPYFRYVEQYTPLTNGETVEPGARQTAYNTFPMPYAAMMDRHVLGGWNRGVSHDDNDLAQAETGALNQLGEGKAELGTMLAESVKTVNLLADRASDLAWLLLFAKRKQWKAIPRQFRISRKSLTNGSSAADFWLEYQYGWRPLCADIATLQRLVNDKIEEPLLLSAQRTVGSSRTMTSFPPEAHIPTGYQVGGLISQSTRVILKAQIDRAGLRAAQQHGVVNPLTIGWELVPYSFVVDWFVPVGNTLSALTATAGLTFVDGCKTVRGELDATVFSGSASAKWDAFSVHRTPYSGFPMPSLYGKRHPFRTSNVLSAIALIRKLF